MLSKWFKDLKPNSDAWLRLDMLRFVASIAIVWHHSHYLLHPVSQRAAVRDQTLGFALFVDLFFIISGFIISAVYTDRIKNWSTTVVFWQRRIARLVPLHLLILLLSWSFWQVSILWGRNSGIHTRPPGKMCDQQPIVVERTAPMWSRSCDIPCNMVH